MTQTCRCRVGCEAGRLADGATRYSGGIIARSADGAGLRAKEARPAAYGAGLGAKESRPAAYGAGLRACGAGLRASGAGLPVRRPPVRRTTQHDVP